MPDLDQIKTLREQTGAGMLDVQSALAEANGDPAKAVEILRKKGQKIAAKKQERVAKEGVVASYVHGNGKVGVLVALACETDFVARGEDFQGLAHDLALQIAAANPSYVKPEDVPVEVIAKEEEIARAALAAEGKPAELADKILPGKLARFYAEVCLLNQPFVKDDGKTIAQLIEQLTAKLGEKIEVKGFARLAL